ncbi:hypothetical protein FLL45_22455 [Aliikangiella marina]|uniref:Porin family protein n=1 Tax=Aliikangiella marina TaxID=1712262 RepID=A0A545T1K5_9GAMM|nr:hypothetical protein [Aliikangiella marina]TQV71092.1 hypothetical protein FLL45_22455 [Aliikangiella marina]
MKFFRLFLFIVLTVTLFMPSPADASSSSNFKLGLGYDLDGGITAQYRGYSFFINGDALAIDWRLENFTNDKKSLHVYIDLGGFIENYDGNDSTRDDRVGLRAPVGITLGITRELQAYIQAVPNYDFNNDEGFEVDGAIGIRYRF